MADRASEFASQQFWWLRQVAVDEELPPLATQIAVAFTIYFNEKTHQAWPSHETLGKLIGVSSRAIRKNVAIMLERGHLTIIGSRKGGPSHPNRYQLRLDPEKIKSLKHKIKTVNVGTPVPPLSECRNGDSAINRNGGTKVPEWRNESAKNGGTGVPPNLLSEPIKEPSSTTDTKMDARSWFLSDSKSEARIAAYEAFKAAPPRALDIDTQIARFTESDLNRNKRLADEEWWRLWRAWCQQAVERARRV